MGGVECDKWVIHVNIFRVGEEVVGGVECDKWVIHVNVFRELVRRWWVV